MPKRKPIIMLYPKAPERLIRVYFLKSPNTHQKLVLFVLSTRPAYGKMRVFTAAARALL